MTTVLPGTTALVLYMMITSTFQREPPWKRVVYSLKSTDSTITDSHTTVSVFSDTECASLCTNLTAKNCSAFSLTRKLVDSSSLECRIASTLRYNSSKDSKSSLFERKVVWAVGYKTADGYELAEDGRFYKKYLEPLPGRKTLAHARNACNADGADLAVPYPRFRQLAIIKFLGPDISQNFHVGIRRIDATEGVAGDEWMTDDGFTFNSSQAEGDVNQNWGKQEPDKDGPSVYINNAGWRPPGQWSDCKVNWTMEKAMYLCRKDDDYVPMGERGKSYKLHYEERTYREAEAICAAEKASLANLRDVRDFHAISGITKRLLDLSVLTTISGKAAFYVAGTDSAVEDTWVFPDGLSIETAEWTRNSTTDQQWQSATGEPNSGRNENCLAYYPYGFADVGCNGSQQKRFLCEKEDTET